MTDIEYLAEFQRRFPGIGYVPHAEQIQRVKEAIAQEQAQAQAQSPQGIYSNLLTEYRNAQEQARAANENRYQEILAGHQGNYARAMSLLQNLGTQQQADVRSRGAALGAQTQQGLVSQGLAGTTIAPTMQAGVARQTGDEMRRAQEAQARLRLGVDTDLTQARLAFMERRTDQYPDLSALMQLSAGMGNSRWGTSMLGWRAPRMQYVGQTQGRLGLT